MGARDESRVPPAKLPAGPRHAPVSCKRRDALADNASPMDCAWRVDHSSVRVLRESLLGATYRGPPFGREEGHPLLTLLTEFCDGENGTTARSAALPPPCLSPLRPLVLPGHRRRREPGTPVRNTLAQTWGDALCYAIAGHLSPYRRQKEKCAGEATKSICSSSFAIGDSS